MNIVQFSILIETLGAVLVAFDILLPKPWRESLDTAVCSWLRPGNRSINAIVATAISALIVVGWAVITDLQSSQYNENTFPTILFMLAGVLAGIAIPLVVTRFVLWLIDIARAIFRIPDNTVDQGVMIYFVAIGISMVGIFGFAWAASISLISLVSVMLTFIITAAFLGAWINAVPFLQRFLSFQRGSVSRIGILVFIAAKIMQYWLSGIV